MEISDLFKSMGLIMICIVGLGTFYLFGVNHFNITETQDLLGYNMTEEYADLLGEDLSTVQNGTITTGDDNEILGGIGSIIKGVTSTPKWLGFLSSFTGNALNNLPISNELKTLIILTITGIIIATVVVAFWRWRT